ncbi:Hypothetical_protein [Hexamita inflata]|uniref:Hypothetical_protein n=1 Tax=Hexamita inflata TaxID=28002 RepID=A0AA86NTU4_9EUKA|nr:Hypothetical protein HINF_LOCUS13071 [Hexamita inflata]
MVSIPLQILQEYYEQYYESQYYTPYFQHTSSHNQPGLFTYFSHNAVLLLEVHKTIILTKLRCIKSAQKGKDYKPHSARGCRATRFEYFHFSIHVRFSERYPQIEAFGNEYRPRNVNSTQIPPSALKNIICLVFKSDNICVTVGQPCQSTSQRAKQRLSSYTKLQFKTHTN